MIERDIFLNFAQRRAKLTSRWQLPVEKPVAGVTVFFWHGANNRIFLTKNVFLRSINIFLPSALLNSNDFGPLKNTNTCNTQTN